MSLPKPHFLSGFLKRRGLFRPGPRTALLLLLGAVFSFLSGCAFFPTQSQEEQAAVLNRMVLPKTPPSRESAVYYHFILGELYAQQNNAQKAVAEFELALAGRPDSPSLLLEVAQQYYRMAEVDKALVLIRKAVQLDPKFKEAYQLLGEMEIAQGRWAEASKTFQTLLQNHPGEEDPQFFLGLTYLQLRKYPQAQDVFKKIIQTNPKSDRAYYFLGKVYLAQKQYDQAQKAFQETVGLQPLHEGGFLGLGFIYEATDQPKQALAMYQKVLQINPDSLEARERMADQYLQLDKPEQAREIIQDLKRRTHNDFEIRFRIALVYLENKRLAEAQVEFEALLQEKPGSEKVRYGLANTLVEKNELKKAETVLTPIGPQSDFYSQALVLRAFILEKEKKVPEAIQLLQNALVVAPKRIDLYLTLASLYEQNSQFAEGLSILKEGLEVDPDNAELYFRTAVILDKMGKKKEAVAQLKIAITKDPFHISSLNYLGYTYAEKGIHLDEAEELVKRALKFKPNDGFIIDSLGWVYYKKKKWDEALAELEKAWKLVPNDPVIGEHLADVYVRKNFLEKALKTYRKVLELNPATKEREGVLKKIKEVHERLEEEKRNAERLPAD
jgi:tetratricopeptide (TPR) repeat protein